jgi:hypothetical protein
MGVEASGDALTVLEFLFFDFVPSNGGQPARRRELEDHVLRRAEKASAVAQHKDAVGPPEPGNGDTVASRAEGRHAWRLSTLPLLPGFRTVGG